MTINKVQNCLYESVILIYKHFILPIKNYIKVTIFFLAYLGNGTTMK